MINRYLVVVRRAEGDSREYVDAFTAADALTQTSHMLEVNEPGAYHFILDVRPCPKGNGRTSAGRCRLSQRVTGARET
jgi:hypothetical protein